MPSFAASQEPRPQFQPLMQALARAAQSVALYDAAAHRAAGHGLTPSQADVVFTLGGTDGLTCSDLTAETLITKGTLTGVIDRLRAKGLVERWEDANDGRRTIIALTPKGNRLFKSAFPAHVAQLEARFSRLPERDHKRATALLEELSSLFDRG